MGEVDEAIMQMQNKRSGLFVEWIPNNAKVSVCSTPPLGQKVGAAFIANNTALQDVMGRFLEQFCKMFKRKAFVHWYTNEGLDPLSFNDVSAIVQHLIVYFTVHYVKLGGGKLIEPISLVLLFLVVFLSICFERASQDF